MSHPMAPLSSYPVVPLPWESPLATIDPADPKAVVRLMHAIEAASRPPASGLPCTLRLEGRPILVSAADLERLRVTARRAIHQGFVSATQDLQVALAEYNRQASYDREHWLVSAVVYSVGATQVESMQLQTTLSATISWATQARQQAERALAAGSLARAAELMVACETQGQDAKRRVTAFIKKTFGTAESTVRVLQYTRTAALVTLGVLATIATAGATAGAGSTVLGLQVGGTVTAANVIATGTPIVATLGEAGATAALDERVDWRRVGVEIVANLVLARFGGQLAEGLFRSLLALR